jgi:Tudor domain
LQNPAGKYVDLRLTGPSSCLDVGYESLLFDVIPNDKVLRKDIETIHLDIQKSMMLAKRNQNDEVGYKLGTLSESPDVKCTDEFNFPPVSVPQMVKITTYDEGVNSFYVRFELEIEQCRRFTLAVNALADNLIPLRLLLSKAALNTICLARYDNRIFRAKIVQVEGKLPNHSVVIQLLESGLKVTLNIDKLFKIPHNIALVPPFAKRFKLRNFEPNFMLEQQEIDFYFRHITNEKVLSLTLENDTGELKIVALKSC